MESTSPYQIHYAALQTRIQAFQASMHHFLQVYTKTPGQYSQDSLHLVTQHLEHNYHTLLNECQNYINQLDFLEKTSTVIDNTFSPHLPVSSNNLATISSQSISHDMSCFDINLLDMNLTPPQPEYTLHPTQPIVSIQSQSNQTKSNKKIKTLPLQNKQYFNLIPIKAIPFQDNMNIIDINSSNYDIELEACLQILSPDVAPTIINPSLSNLPSISPNDNIPLMINYSDKGSNNFIHSEQLHQQCKLLAKTFGLSHTNLVLPQLYDNQPHNIPLALPQLTVTQGAMSHGLLIIRRLTLLTLQCELLGSFFLNFFKFNETRDVSSTSGSHVHQGVIPAPPQSQQQVLLQQQQQLLRQQQQQQQLQRYQQEMYNEQQQQQRLQGFAQGFQ